MTITYVTIKPPDRKYDRGREDVMPGSDGPRILEFEKNIQLRFDARGRKLIFGARRVCGGVPYVVGSDGKVSIERNCVSLSPHAEKP